MSTTAEPHRCCLMEACSLLLARWTPALLRTPTPAPLRWQGNDAYERPAMSIPQHRDGKRSEEGV